ncbi:hypothetical protein G9P44_005696 [Scheffersomyces stipitis]|nr:hypothetical protein G9P44_005696 [Scheffersomyces stipitis]
MTKSVEIIDLSDIPDDSAEVIEILDSESDVSKISQQTCHIDVDIRSPSCTQPLPKRFHDTSSLVISNRTPFSKRNRSIILSSSPPSTGQLFVTEDETIEESSFSFSQQNQKQRQDQNINKEPNTSILDVVHWLSDSSMISESDPKSASPSMRRKTQKPDVNILPQFEEDEVENAAVSSFHNSQNLNFTLSSSQEISIQGAVDSHKNKTTSDTTISSKPVVTEISPPRSKTKTNEYSLSFQSKNTSVSPTYGTNLEPKSKKVEGSPSKSKSRKANVKVPAVSKEMKDANRVTRSKEELLSEMIIMMAPCVKSMFKQDYLVTQFEKPHISDFISDLPMICWNRKVKALYNPETDLFVPCEETELQEKNIVLYYEAQEFFEKVHERTLKYQVNRALSLRKQDNDTIMYKIIIMVEGYDVFINKLKRMEQNKYKSKVLDRLNEPDSLSSSQSQPKRRKNTIEPTLNITAKEAELLMNSVQIELKVNIFTVRNSSEAVDWLLSYTYAISYSLYDKFERNSSLANIGVVRSGSDSKSTFIGGVRQFKLLTEAKAERLYSHYPSLQSIYQVLTRSGALERDGNGKNLIPPSAESAMLRFFTSEDPHEAINE